MNPKNIVCFGEILWDVFPNKKYLGGAPLNVALRLHSLGYKAYLLSCIGEDKNGAEVLEHLKTLQFPTQGIQQNINLPTGIVQVHLDDFGGAQYKIASNVAWDAIYPTKQAISLVEKATVFVFGSLACRSAINKETIIECIEKATFTVFDINLRPPFYNLTTVVEIMKKVNFIKLNKEELNEICYALQFYSTKDEEQAVWLKNKLGCQYLCVTLGAEGALFLFKNQLFFQKGFKVKVKDTVGAGDSFLATLIGQLFIEGKTPKKSLKKACAIGSLVASKAGANCMISSKEIQSLLLG